MINPSLELLKKLKEEYPDNIEFHSALDNRLPSAWDFVKNEADSAMKQFKSASNKAQKICGLFNELSQSGYPVN